VNAALLLVYAIADLFVWATVSAIPNVTEVFWSPIYILVYWRVSPGSSGSMFGGNAGFIGFIAIIAANLALAHAGTRKYAIASILMFGYFALSNDVQYSNLVSLISGFQDNLTWNHVYITVGSAATIIPNLTLFVALATTIVNIMYIRRTSSLPSKVQAVE
jgi:hypothetical protein